MSAWRDVRAGDTILGKDGNHYVLLDGSSAGPNEEAFVKLFRAGKIVTVQICGTDPVTIVDRPTATAVQVIVDAGIVSNDEQRRLVREGVLERLSRRNRATGLWNTKAEKEEYGF